MRSSSGTRVNWLGFLLGDHRILHPQDLGIDWRYDNEDENSEQNVPIASQEIVKYVMDISVLSAAADQTNRRIEMYLEREHD